jgi:S-adenosylmethionine hydrolase
VLIVDRFGNATLDLPGEILAPLLRRGDSEAGFRIVTPGGVVDRFCRTYAEGEAGVPFALFNSAGYLEIAVRGGNAARTLGLAAGEKVEFLLE